MRTSGWLLRAVLLSAVIAAPVDVAVACSCMPSGPPCQSTFQVDAVFAGTVRSISALPDDGPALRPGEMRLPRALQVQFVDILAFRGVQAATVSLVTAGSGPSCGYAFKQGERYLVYANRTVDGTGLVTGICSRTRPLADAAEDLRFLQGLTVGGRTQARVYGTVTHGERDLATGQGLTHGPVSDVIVTVRGAGKTYEAVTDARGQYEVFVPSGKYDVSAIPPVRFSSRHLQQTIELPDNRACFVADFGVHFDGRISGRVRQPSGEPAVGAFVQVMAADSIGKMGNVQTLHVASDSGGRFEFTDVSPGRYVVGVDLTRRMDADVVFPTTFHPGTSEAGSPTIIELKGGERRELEPLTLPAPRRSHRLTGTVVFEDGRPAAGAFISLRDGREPWRQVAVGIKTGDDGSFAFVVHEGLSYIASASYWDEATRKQGAGRVGPFVIDGNTRPLRVMLSPR